MWFMNCLSWLSLIVHICFITLSIAAGLFYLAELVEEFTVLTGKIIKYMVWFTTLLYIGLLLFEGLPISLIGIGLVCNALYLLVLQGFPFIELSSPTFIVTIILIVIHHWYAFSYFSETWHPFSEVLAFFTLCLWLVPFAFFVSLSANENVLPTLGDTSKPDSQRDDGDLVSNYFNRRRGQKFSLLSFLKNAQESLLPQRVKKGY